MLRVLGQLGEGARSWAAAGAELAPCGHVLVLHGCVLSAQYRVLRVVGGEVKEGCMDFPSFFLVRREAVCSGDIKPLAGDLRRSQEQVMEAESFILDSQLGGGWGRSFHFANQETEARGGVGCRSSLTPEISHHPHPCPPCPILRPPSPSGPWPSTACPAEGLARRL